MSYISEQELKLTQEDWKRTQLRMPQNLYAAVKDYAKENDLSLNSAMLDLMNKGIVNAQAKIPSIQDELIQMHKDAKEILESLKALKEKPTN